MIEGDVLWNVGINNVISKVQMYAQCKSTHLNCQQLSLDKWIPAISSGDDTQGRLTGLLAANSRVQCNLTVTKQWISQYSWTSHKRIPSGLHSSVHLGNVTSYAVFVCGWDHDLVSA